MQLARADEWGTTASRLDQKCPDICFKVRAVNDADVLCRDSATIVYEIGDRKRLNRIPLGDPVVAHQDRVVNAVGFYKYDRCLGLLRLAAICFFVDMK